MMTNNKVKSSTIEWTLAVIESSHLLTRPKENLWTSTTTVQRLKVSFYIQLYPIGFIISHAAIKCNTWWWKQKGMISAPLKVLKKKTNWSNHSQMVDKELSMCFYVRWLFPRLSQQSGLQSGAHEISSNCQKHSHG